MHELSVVAGLFEILEDNARKHKARAITMVRLRVGDFAGIVPELLESAFEMYKKGTVAESARLEIVRVPALFKCPGCGGRTFREDPGPVCADCGGREPELVQGRELVVESIEIEAD